MPKTMTRILTTALVWLSFAFGGAAEASRGGAVMLDRTELAPGLAWYRFELPVGEGPHDRLRLHRVVRERAPWQPARARKGVFLAHGDGWAFGPTFLAQGASPALPSGPSFAQFLAEQGVDVWGLDFRWSLVPAATTDLSFMTEWGFEVQLADLDSALAAARLVRAATGSGASPLTLVGFSRGGQLGWAQLSAESQRPNWRRHVSGFIAAGTVFSDNRFVAEVGALALSAPLDPSPWFPSLSNADFAELVGASSVGGSIPDFHSAGGIISPGTFVTELLYTAPPTWFTFLLGISPYQPLALNRDGAAVVCDQLDVPWDDHLGEVEVPILYLGAAGAFGARGFDTVSRTASTDVTSLVVTAGTPITEDWGHNELFLANDAPFEVWQEVVDWLLAR